MSFRPLHDRVLVRRVKEEEKTKGGIIIPDTVKEKPQEGKIVAVGSGARGEDGKVTPLDVKAGDRVLFGKWSGTRSHHRRRGAHHHERERHPRHRRKDPRREEVGLAALRPSPFIQPRDPIQWQPNTYNSPPTPASA